MTQIMLIRHAEKANESVDSPLSDDGAKRALNLISVCENSHIKFIYSSQFKRNLDTVKLLSEKINTPIVIKEVNLDEPKVYAENLTKEILANHLGQNILIVSHSNTIPLLIENLIGKKLEIKKVEYSDFYIVSIRNNGEKSFLKLQYGK